MTTATAERDTINQRISKNVRHLLLDTDERAKALAGVLGCHPKTLSRRLSKGYDWDAWEVAVIAEHFDVPVSLLYSRGMLDGVRSGGSTFSTMLTPIAA